MPPFDADATGTAADDTSAAYLRTEFRTRDLREVLAGPVRAINAVADDAVACLATLDINSVFDLATSRVFANARAIDDAGGDQGHLFRRSGLIAGDMFDGAYKVVKPVEELRYEPVEVLSGIGAERAQAVTATLHVKTIQELAHYPPYRAARTILESVFFPESRPNFDAESPPDLVPKNGEYPTERVRYTSLLFDGPGSGAGAAKTEDILADTFAPIDLSAAMSDTWGFQEVAFGTLLTFTQSWYMEGLTLGQLLHSTALAPGESTPLAVTDWSRRSRAGQTETITEVDDLTNDTNHTRSISEVTSAVAREAQGGFSGSQQSSTSKQSATSSGYTGGDGGGGLGGAVVDLVEGGLKASVSILDDVIPF